jgi:hypothetical protein
MIHVTVGSDTYGRVKTVGTTPIVTRVGMISSLPVFPLESFYFVRVGERTSQLEGHTGDLLERIRVQEGQLEM